MKHGEICRMLFCAIAMLALPSIACAGMIIGEPDAYLDYIEATGSQYIDTGVNAETGLKARVDLAWGGDGTKNDDWSMLDAATVASASDNRSRVFLCHIYNQKPFFGYGLKVRGNPASSFNFVRGNRCEIVSDVTSTDSMELLQNGAKTFSAADREKYAAIGNGLNLNLSLYLFACNYGGNPNWYAKAKLYECKIFKKNAGTGELELVRHYLPCVKNGRAGLYDKANGTISFSYGSADFVAGPMLDKPLALVESLTSDGDNSSRQCFNTWVYGKSGLKSEVEVSVINPSIDSGVLACRETAGDTRLFMAYYYQSAFRFATGTLADKSNLNVITPKVGVRYVIKTDTTPGAQSMTVSADGGEAVEVLKDDFDYGTSYIATTNTLSILAAHRAYDGYYITPAQATIYATKIWDGDERLRDFVPAVATNSVGDVYAGLYDRVTERIYRPINGNRKIDAEFPFDLSTQVGAITNVLVDVDEPKIRLEYVDSDGVSDYVDLGVIGKDGLEMNAVMEWLTVPSDGAFVGARNNSQTNNRNAQGVRFFPYHHWSGHRLGYSGELVGIFKSDNSDSIVATAGVKYRISSHLDYGSQQYSVTEFSNDEWTPVGNVTASYKKATDTELPLYLFAVNIDGVPKYFGHSRVYSLKLRVKDQDGAYAIARDLVPVRDPLTGGAAFWDRASGTYLRNSSKFLLSGGGAERPFEGPFMIVVR